MRKILIPVDGSQLCLDAVRHGLDLVAHGLRAEFVLANVQEPPSLYEIITVRDPDILEDVSASAGAHMLEQARALCDSAGVAYECDIASGDPAHTLIDLVERHGCDSLIMGAGSRGGLAGSLLGSVSQEIAHACPVPVTLVKHASQDQDEQAAQSISGEEATQ